MADYKVCRIENDDRHGAPVQLEEKSDGYHLTVGCKGLPALDYVDCLRIFKILRMMFPAIEDRSI